MRYYVIAAAAATFFVAPAMAQNAAPFTGPRVEGLIGQDSVSVVGAANKGLLYGVGAGYDFRVGGAVLGIEGEYTNSEADECRAITGAKFCTEIGRDYYLGVRAGAQIGSNSLLYVKAGYTNSRLETDYSTDTIGEEVSRRFTLGGYRIGAGGEYAISPAAYLKAEYRYSRYEQDDQIVGGNALAPYILPGSHRTKQQLVAGFGFRF